MISLLTIIKYQWNWLIPIILLLCFSCEKKSNWETNNNNTPQLVVEALLTNEFKNQEIRLSLSTNDLNQQPTPITDATVMVSNSIGNSFQFSHEANGQYTSNNSFSISQDIQHQLTINWNGEQYEATNTDAEVKPIDTIEFVQTQNDTAKFRLKDNIPLYSIEEQAMYQFDCDWSSITGDSSAKARIYEYTFSDYHINEVSPPPKKIVTFPIGTQVIVRKYGLNNEYAHFLMSTLISTEWNGNLFYSTNSSPPTNISNGGLGFFAVARVVTDTLVVQ